MGDRVKGKADDILDAFGSRVVDLARINLGRSYTARRSNGKSYRKRIDSSGQLRNSLGYDVLTRGEDGRFISARLEFDMLEYGRYVDAGRRPGKGVPFNKSNPTASPLGKWIKKKPIRIRDLETGSFVKATDSRINSLIYLINRKIKKHGIKPTNFISEPLEDEFPKFAQSLAEALGDDYTAAIANSIDDGSSKK